MRIPRLPDSIKVGDGGAFGTERHIAHATRRQMAKDEAPEDLVDTIPDLGNMKLGNLVRLACRMSPEGWAKMRGVFLEYGAKYGFDSKYGSDNSMEQLPASGIDPTGIGGRLNEERSTDPERALDAATRSARDMVAHGDDGSARVN